MEDVEMRLTGPIVESLLSTFDLSKLLAEAAEQFGHVFGASRCIILLDRENYPNSTQAPVEWCENEPEDSALDQHILFICAYLQHLLRPFEGAVHFTRPEHDPDLSGVQANLAAVEAGSLIGTAVRFQGKPLASVILLSPKGDYSWGSREVRLLEYLAGFLGIAIRNCFKQVSDTPRHTTTADGITPGVCSLITYDADGRIEAVNRMAEDITGYSREELQGLHYRDYITLVVAEEDQDKVRLAYESAELEGIMPPSIVYRMRHRELGIFSRVLDQLGPRENEAGLESVCLDITEQGSNWTRLEPGRASSEDRYRRLVEHSDAIIFHCEPDHTITFVSRRALDFFGVAPEDFLAGTPVHWFDLVHLEDRERVCRRAAEMEQTSESFDEEFRVINHITGQVRWLLTKFVPVRDQEDDEVLGWDGFGIDITARREAQIALDTQSKKVRALYTVSSAIRGYLDPANIASRGLAALCDATGATAGLSYLYPSKSSKNLELVAHHGFSADFDESIEARSTLPSLSRYVAEHGQSIVVPDVRNDPRASRMLSDEEGVRSAVLVPISVEEEILGTLGLFHPEVSKFDGGDVMLVAAAANQIGLAARQASLFSAYRKQTKNLAALYRLSHELSGFLSMDEVFHNAFTVIRDELGLKRLWLGMLNETGTRLIGQAAFGPGWKRRLVEVNVEIRGREHPIAQVVTTRKSMIIDDPDKVLSEFGVKRFFSRFSVNSVGLVPLISGGQVLGVLAFQPGPDEPRLEAEEMTLLSSLASEIAAVLLTKRLEERIGAGEKMRTAGLLAAGIAHNFNNLLQAILGQASLLEMQGSDKRQVQRAAKIITTSATKGASLVKQLMSFANLEEPSSEVCDLNAVLERATDALRRELDEGQRLELNLGEQLPRAHVDPRQVLRIITALVANAREAMSKDGRVEIFTDFITVDRESPHFEVPFGEYLRVGVRDNGSGMDQETKRRCFEPFYTTKDIDPSSGIGMSGAGLGLAAAYTLARKNGGRLVVDSRKGHGSVFTLYVPVGEVDAQESKTPELRVAVAGASQNTAPELLEDRSEQAQANLKLLAPTALEIEVERVSGNKRADETGKKPRAADQLSGNGTKPLTPRLVHSKDDSERAINDSEEPEV